MEGEITDEVWWGDEVTPDAFKKDLYSATVGDTNDTVLKQLSKVKDSNGQYIWQLSIKDGVPDTMLGKHVYTSAFVLEIAPGSLSLAFGDFSYYWITAHSDIRFKVLKFRTVPGF